MSTGPATISPDPIPASVQLAQRSARTRGFLSGGGFVARFVRKPVAVASLVYLVLVVLAVLFAGAIAPYGPTEQDLGASLSGPSAAHWLGAGDLGKDVFSRILYGGQVTLLGVVIMVSVFAVIGIPAGLIAGYRGGRFAWLVVKVADLAFAVPGIIIMLAVLAIFARDESAAMAASGLLAAPQMARVVRSATMGVRQELYVRAAVASGIRDMVIIPRHVLPRVTGVIINQMALMGAAAVLMETGLGYMGVGTLSASWGNLIAEASRELATDPWLLVPSGGIVITFILALNLMGDGVRDAIAEAYAPSSASSARRTRAHADRPAVKASGSAAAGAAEPVRRSAPAGTLLSARDVSVTLIIDGKPTTVISDVSFDLGPGEALGIVGESGCGKTITAKSLLGLLPAGGRLTAGNVWFDGTDLAQASTRELRRIRAGRIGWISQDPISSLDPSFTAGAQVAEAVRVHTGCSGKKARERALELLAKVQLPDPEGIARSYPHQLSGGMAQRVGIAAALAGDPTLIIADEPTTALDVTVQAEILGLLRDLQQAGTAIILITHDFGVLADLCQRAVVMYAGQVVEQADLVTIFRTPAHPYTSALLRSDPHHAAPGEPLPALEGVVPAPAAWPIGCHFQNRCPLVKEECREAPIRMTNAGSGSHETRCIRAAEMMGGRAR